MLPELCRTRLLFNMTAILNPISGLGGFKVLITEIGTELALMYTPRKSDCHGSVCHATNPADY